MLSLYLVTALAAFCFRSAAPLPSLAFPIQAQLPPVAVAEQLFSFTFAPTTFTSTSAIDYSAEGLPGWLYFDSAQRILSGTPISSDVGELELHLKATDSDGTTVTSFKLVVVQNNFIKSNDAQFVDRLTRANSYSAPSTLLLYPCTSFDLDLGPGIFGGDGVDTYYYATSGGNAPLPAWMQFDNRAVKFYGTTPSLLTPQSSPQTFGFAVLASQFQGYSQTRLEFEIAVTNHILAFTDPVQSLNISAGETLSIQSLMRQLRYDSQPAQRDQIQKVSSNSPSWLILDQIDLSLSGVAPSNVADTSVRVEVTDDSRNTAFVDIKILVTDSKTTGVEEVDLGTIEAVCGASFIYTFVLETFDNVDALSLDADLGPLDTWLTYTSTNYSIHGLVPDTVVDTTANISANLKRDEQIVRREHLTLSFVSPKSTSTVVQPDSPEATSTTSGEATAGDHHTSHNPLVRRLPLIITLPVLALIFLCISVACIVKRARKRKVRHIPSQMSTHSVQRESSDHIVVIAESEPEFGSDQAYRPPSVAPQIGLVWTTQQSPTSRRLLPGRTSLVDSPDTRSSWEDMLTEARNDNPFQDIRSVVQGHENDRPNYMSPSFVVKADQVASPALSTISTAAAMSRAEHPAAFSAFYMARANRSGNTVDLDNSVMNNGTPTLRQVPRSPFAPTAFEEPMNGPQLARKTRKSNGKNPEYTILANDLARARSASSAKRSSASKMSSLRDPVRRELPHLVRDRRGQCGSTGHRGSTSFSGSLWEDAEISTQDGTSKSGNWQIEGLSDLPGSASQATSLGARRLKRWVETTARSDGSGVIRGTSIRSQQSEQSQTHSLRFI